jgi:hypothetical protein
MPTTTTFRSELESTLYRCAEHRCWLRLRELTTSTGEHYRFWQCPVVVNHTHCQKCKPCKRQQVGTRWRLVP